MFHCYFMVTLIACTMLFAGLVVLIISLVLDIIYKTRFDLEYLGSVSYTHLDVYKRQEQVLVCQNAKEL